MITVTERVDHTLLSVQGAFDRRCARLTADLLRVANSGEIFVVDLGGVTGMDHEAVAELMDAYRRARGRGVELRFGGISPAVRRAASRDGRMEEILGC